MGLRPNIKILLLAFLIITMKLVAASSCNSSALNATEYLYPMTVASTTIFDVANATNRGVCDIARINITADVEIVPNVGQ